VAVQWNAIFILLAAERGSHTGTGRVDASAAQALTVSAVPSATASSTFLLLSTMATPARPASCPHSAACKLTSSLRSALPSLLLGGAAAAGAAFGVCKLVQRRNRQSPKLQLDAAAQLAELQAIFPRLCSEFIEDVRAKYEFPEFALQRLQRMFDYNVKGGKYWRATLVLNTVQELCKQSGSNIDRKWEQALVLGWCIEILQALFLVADDMMDGSQLRRKKPCWYLLPDVKFDAVNDTLILESFMWFLLNKYFRGSKQHLPVVELFQSVSYQTQMGQMLDLLSQPQMRRDPELLKNFTLESYHRIVTFKTAIYTFNLSIASGMLLCGYDSPRQLAAARAISIELGKKFQIEDDYLDCYGLPSKIGKDGTDIKDHKCSWLVVQALERVTPEQRTILEEHYGKDEPEHQQRVKDLYKELNLEAVYLKQEEESKQRIEQLIQDNAAILPPGVFRPILAKIHNRDH